MLRNLLTAFCFFIACSSLAQIPTQNLVAYYPFCGNALDMSGNGYHLTNNNATLTTDRFGAAAKAYDFNGVNSILFLSNTLPLGNQYTMSCWIRPTSAQDALCVYNGNSGTNGTGIVYDNGAAVVGTKITFLAGGLCFCMSIPSPINQWYHVVLRKDAVKFKFWINNVLVDSSNTPTNPPNGIFHIGQDYTDGTNPFLGKIDDVAIYDRALTTTEIAQLFNYQCGSFTPQITPLVSNYFTGGSATFSVAPLGTNYQWQQNSGSGFTNLTNGPNYTGVNTNALTISNLTAAMAGFTYRCIFTDISCCLDTSNNGTLSFSPPPPPPPPCVSVLNLPDTIGQCENTTYQFNLTLNSNPQITLTDTTWFPAVGLSNPNILNPLVTLGTSNQTYFLTINAESNINAITNGDFSNGNSGFTSDYTVGTGGAFGQLTNPATYAITTNPSLVHTQFASFGDHTTGTGQMMVVNGAAVANQNIWCQTITVTPNTDYNFAAWFASCTVNNPAILQFSVNGTLLGAPANAPAVTGVWMPFNATWNSGASTSATICITNQNIAAAGNDFALDDISFKSLCSTTDTVTFLVTNLQAAIDTGYRFGCMADTVDFYAINNAQTPDDYFWEFGDGTTGMGAVTEHSYAIQGTYNVRLVVSKNGCTDTATIQVNTVHVLNAGFTASKDSICLGDPITFLSTTGSTFPTTIFWDFGDGDTISNVLNPTHTYTAPGVYTVTLAAQDEIPCVDTARKQIYVAETPTVSINLSNNSFCEGEGVNLVSAITSLYTNFLWTFGDGTTNTTNLNPVHAYDTAGIYTVTLQVNFRLCPSQSASQTLTVNPNPVVNLGPDTSLCVGGTPITVRTSSFDPANNYFWNTGEVNVQSILASHPGIYGLTVTTPSGCSAADSVAIFKDCYIDIPNAFSPNGDGLNDYFFPRQLLGKNITRFSMVIYNRWGQEIFKTTKTDGRGWDGNFNGVGQPVGVYVYLIEVELDGTRSEKYQGNVTLLR